MNHFSPLRYFSLLLIGTISILCSCQNNGNNNNSEPAANNEEIKNEGSGKMEERKVGTPLPKYKRLDNIDLSSFKKYTSEYKEEGDCRSQRTKYEGEKITLVIDSTDCFDYGKTFTFYLLNDLDEIRRIHEKNITPFYEEKNGETEFYYSLSETFVYFGEHTLVKAKTDTISRKPNKVKVIYDKNYQSEPWIVLKEKDDDLLFGEKIDYSSEWYDEAKNKLKNRLSKMEKLPRNIPMKSVGTVGMGHRGEWGSMCDEAIQEVAAEREKASANPFAQIENKEFSILKEPGELGSIIYWKEKFRAAAK